MKLRLPIAWMGIGVAAALACGGCRFWDMELPETPKPAWSAPVHDGRGWWRAGDSACPTLDGGPEGSIPGSLVRTEERIACVAGGTLHGPATETEDGGLRATGAYDRGQRTGRWTARDAAGEVAWTGNYANGERAGPWLFRNSQGNPRAAGAYAAGQRTGMWLLWSDDAGPDERAERFEVYESGKKIDEGVFVLGSPTQNIPVCIVGLAAPSCRVILLGDLSLRLSPQDEANAGGEMLSPKFELGALVNVHPRHSVGFGGGWYWRDAYADRALRGRYRFWPTRFLAVELAPGVTFPRDDVGGASERGLSGELSVIAADLLGVSVDVQRYQLVPERTETAVHFGVRIGTPTLLGAAVVALQLGG